MWSLETVGRVPAAATHYDGISNSGFHQAAHTWVCHPYATTAVLDAIASDRKSVAAFRRNQPAAAKTTGRFLDRYLLALDERERDARAFDGTEVDERRYTRGPYRQLPTYGGPRTDALQSDNPRTARDFSR